MFPEKFVNIYAQLSRYSNLKSQTPIFLNRTRLTTFSVQCAIEFFKHNVQNQWNSIKAAAFSTYNTLYPLKMAKDIWPGVDKSHCLTPRASASLGQASGFFCITLWWTSWNQGRTSHLKIYLSALLAIWLVRVCWLWMDRFDKSKTEV